MSDRNPAKLQTGCSSFGEDLDTVESLLESSRYPEARKKLQEISRNFPPSLSSQESCHFHYLRGLLFFRLGELPAAWVEIEEALRIFKAINGSDSLPERANLPDFIKEKLQRLRNLEITLVDGLLEPDGGQTLEKNRKLEESIAEISSALDNLSPLAKLHFLAGMIRLNYAKLTEAMEHFERAAIGSMLSKEWAVLAKVLNGISKVHFYKGNLGLAIQITEQAIVYSRKAGDRHFETILLGQLANWQLWLGIWRPAVLSLPNILAELKLKDTLNYCSALLQWGLANLLGGRLKESKKAFNEVLRVAFKHRLMRPLKGAYGYFSVFYLETGQFEKAEKHVKKTMEITKRIALNNNDGPFLWRLLGDVYVAHNQIEKARKAYSACQNCLTTFPQKDEEAAMYRGMGVINARQNQPPAARRNFKKSLEIFEACGNQWEKAKTFVVAAESGVFTQAEMEPDIAWTKEVFKRLEHPAWTKRARILLKKAKNSGRAVPLPMAQERTEREQIVTALLACNGNISQAAKKLGLLRQTLQYKIRRSGIEV